MTQLVLAQTKLVWGAEHWKWFVIPLAALMLGLLLWGYLRASATPGLRLLAASLKTLGILILALCLMEPLLSGTRARPGANAFAILADNSQSMNLKDRDATQTRAAQLKELASKNAKWWTQLRQDFDVRQYAYDTQLRSIDEVESLPFDGAASNLAASIERLGRRYKGRPLAGVLLMTDGGATDAEALEKLLAAASTSKNDPNARVLPPIYPVVIGREKASDDVSLDRVAVSQTNFEDAPVTLTAQIASSGYAGKTLVAQLLDESGKPVEQQTIKADDDGKPLALRFRVKPQQAGVSFYQVRVAAEGQTRQFDDPAASTEATLANNTRVVAVDRGGGPYRILYVAGRPNWEFKFLHRGLEFDSQLQLVGLLRIARREPKFNFINRAGDDTNPLFRGFEHKDKQTVEQYDQPVVKAIGPLIDDELRGGFPQKPEDLYRYHAIVLDDLESEFFNQEQMHLLKEFVRQRGGGLLMLGGQESFKNGKYERTPVGDLLPVYTNELPPMPPNAKWKLTLTREGKLEPWVRLRAEEDAEARRVEAMPPFQTLNQVSGIKPGATVLMRAQVEGSNAVPALVEQPFGDGRVAALLIGDLWRWSLRRPENAPDDLEKAWRQMIRWLVANVPQRVEVAATPRRDAEDASGAITLTVKVRDEKYAMLDNAQVALTVTGPDNKPLEFTADASPKQAGQYEAVFVPRQSGAYRAKVTALSPDGSEVGRVETGWTSEPAADEFRDLAPNRDLLRRIAQQTGGELIEPDDLEKFVSALPTKQAQITDPHITPAWHSPWVFLLAILCLTAEWGLRRWKGLP